MQTPPSLGQDSIVRQGALRTPLHVLSGHHRPHPASYWSCRLQTLSAHPRPSAPRRRLLTKQRMLRHHRGVLNSPAIKRLLGILGIVGNSKGSTTAELFAATCCPHVWISGFRVWHRSVIELLKQGCLLCPPAWRTQTSTLHSAAARPPPVSKGRRPGCFGSASFQDFKALQTCPDASQVT